MKVKSVQHTLRKQQKNENLKHITRMTTYPDPDDNTMIAYICKKHGFIFWRNVKTNQGMCLFCKQENISSIKDHHIKDSEITKELMAIVNEKSDERLYEGVNDMKVEKSISIDDGKYTGEIIDVNEVTEPYKYVHFVVNFKVGEATKKLDFSCPSNITVDDKTGKPTSKLAETLEAFDLKLNEGKEITIEDIKKHFVGKSIESLLQNKTSKKGAKIIEVVTMTPQ